MTSKPDCIDPKTQVIAGKSVCLVSCRRSPEPVFLKWKKVEKEARGDFFVRSGPRTDRLEAESVDAQVTTERRSPLFNKGNALCLDHR